MKLSVLKAFLAVVFCMTVPGVAAAQPAEDSPVGVIPEASTSSRGTLRLATGNCDINKVESVLLRTKGVEAVDVESKKGHVIVDYSSNTLTLQRLIDEVAKKQECITQSVSNAALPN